MFPRVLDVLNPKNWNLCSESTDFGRYANHRVSFNPVPHCSAGQGGPSRYFFKRVTQLSGWFRTQRVSYVSYVTEPNATKLDNCWSSQTFSKNATFWTQLFVPLTPKRIFAWDVPKWPTFWPTFCFLSPRNGFYMTQKTSGRTDARTEGLTSIFSDTPTQGRPFSGQTIVRREETHTIAGNL